MKPLPVIFVATSIWLAGFVWGAVVMTTPALARVPGLAGVSGNIVAVLALGRGLPAGGLAASAGVLAVFRQRDEHRHRDGADQPRPRWFRRCGSLRPGLAGFYASASVWLAYGGLVLGARQAGPARGGCGDGRPTARRLAGACRCAVARNRHTRQSGADRQHPPSGAGRANQRRAGPTTPRSGAARASCQKRRGLRRAVHADGSTVADARPRATARGRVHHRPTSAAGEDAGVAASEAVASGC